MYRLIWVFASYTGLIVGFVVRWLNYHLEKTAWANSVDQAQYVKGLHCLPFVHYILDTYLVDSKVKGNGLLFQDRRLYQK